MISPDLIGAVILAAGNGSRMGGPKVRAQLGGETFLDRILRTLSEAGIQSIRCVVRPDDEHWMREHYPYLPCVVNPDPSEGMLSSVRRGTEELAGVEGILIVPVDHPLVRCETYRILMAAYSREDPSFCKPVYESVPGHPILIPKSFVQDILDAPDDATLNSLVFTSPLRKTLVRCDDPGILRNLNRPSDIVGQESGTLKG